MLLLTKTLSYTRVTKKDKKKESINLELLRVLVKKDGQFLAYKKSDNEWLSGQKEFPTFILKTSDKSLSQYPYWDGQVNLNLKSLKKFKTGITKYKITNYVLEISEEKWKKVSHVEKDVSSMLILIQKMKTFQPLLLKPFLL